MKLVNEFNNSKYEHFNKPSEAFSEETGCFTPDPIYKKEWYSFFYSKTIKTSKCSFRKVEIVAENENSKLFGQECFVRILFLPNIVYNTRLKMNLILDKWIEAK